MPKRERASVEINSQLAEYEQDTCEDDLFEIASDADPFYLYGVAEFQELPS